ncbi:MAG: 3-deoxy-7-phosphoheptulonate synthase [Erysipelotrichia bacterium]|nr:3-deoxy-7-phosphoheptulonate synthase [Erysipelotrichia bacterium]NCC55032.1 3-deoxy-7-phosphoheptulonate synthase [Erysipelotrichia bacterium]
MIITFKKDVPRSEVEKLIHTIEQKGLKVHSSIGADYQVYGIIGDTTILDEKVLRSNHFVEEVTRVSSPYKKASRMFHPEDSIIDVGGIKVGGKEAIVVIGGPCSVEGEAPLMNIAQAVKKAGASMLRGGAYKPRTSPYAFQGMESEGIQCLRNAKQATNLPIVSELMDKDQLPEFIENVDLIQVGARNMQNFALLKALGKINKPILLKRGLSNTMEEWLMAAEYIMAGGNENVILCERGIRTFEKYTRNTLDLSVIPIIKKRSHLPIIIDPSHATGDWELVESMSLAAIAAGADGLIIEVHDNPECAWSDGAQSLKPEKFKQVIEKGRKIAHVIGRDM